MFIFWIMQWTLLEFEWIEKNSIAKPGMLAMYFNHSPRFHAIVFCAWFIIYGKVFKILFKCYHELIIFA